MASLNDNLKNINLLEVLFIILVLFIASYIFNINQDWIYVALIIYFIYRLRGSEIKDIYLFSNIPFKFILLIVLLNIFFSYGMLYCANWFINYSSDLIPLNYSIAIGGFLSTVVIAPVSEELLFRGVFLNKLKLIVPTTYAILISSLIFGLLHSFGSIISAFVFGICMCIIYLKTDNILLSIFTHFLNNLFAEIILFIDYEGIIFTNSFVIIFFTILAIISLYLILSSIKLEWDIINNK